ncbi:hypothetical protein EST38_g12719 [Candolleomyces aberdarensis]|uniref:Uncharacterized protein n=1 Tax=Candolleomyces aberdarensis TaxID=2316362 RepID=A0A4Q2D1P6_9AGAR|nr:hypothetical protein EST38_g12719 [Candolleomyces aberdarensis]
MGRNTKKQKVEIFRYVPPAPTPRLPPRPSQYVELSRHYESGDSGAPILVSQQQLHLPQSPVKKGSATQSAGSGEAVNSFPIPIDDIGTPNFDTPPSNLDWDGEPLPDLVEDSDDDSDLGDQEDDSGEEEEMAKEPSENQAKKRKRSAIGDNPFLHFIPKVDMFVEEMLRLEAPDRYTAWLRMIRTSPGELAVMCPACPYPDINLPPDYEQLPEGDQWKYTLFLGMDANFRLRRVKVSSEERDPGLSKGYSFIVDEAPFKAYLSKYNPKIEDDKSDCRNHDAIKSASIRASSFKDKAVDAIAARKDQMAAFVAFSKALPLEIVGRWTGDVQAWERDPCLETSPFRQEGDGKTEAEVRRELAEEDRKLLQQEEGMPLHNVSPSQLIGKAIEIEDQQRRLAIDTSALGPHSTDLQHAKVLERSNSLKRKIDGWVAIQHIYMPSLALLRKQEEEEGTGSEATPVHAIKLLLPSSVSRRVDIPARFRTLELRYRKAQGFSTLRDLRAQLLLKSHMLHSKRAHAVGVRQTTRSSALIQNLESRIGSTAEKYRHVYACLSALSPDENAGWRQELFPLRAEDVKVLTLDQEGGEGHRALTWIWKVKGTVEMKDDPEVQAALRIEWCKTRARAHRWQEECLLLSEEMRRVTCFFEWQISAWNARGEMVVKQPAQPVSEGTPAAIVELNERAYADISRGRLAFAARTANMWTRMLETVRTAWAGLDAKLSLHPVFVEDSRL